MKTVLLLHGMGGPNPLNHIEEGLKLKYNVLKPTMPGFHASDGKINYSDEFYMQFLETYRKQKKEESFIVIGYSMGGKTALNYAIQYPERVDKLILIDSVGVTYMIPLLRFKAGRQLLRGVLPHLLKYSFMVDMLGKSEFVCRNGKEYRQGKAWILKMMKDSIVRKNYVEILTSIGAPIPDLDEKLKTLNMPVELLWAQDDRTARVKNAYWLKEHLTNCELHILEKYRHMAPMENPSFYTDHILAFASISKEIE